MSYPIEVLMIDDDMDNFHSLKNSAAKNRIILRYSSNLKDGIAILKESKKILAVILDGKGHLEPNQERGSEKEDFVHEALTKLAILEVEQNRVIPKCVLTAWYDKLLASLESRVKVYDKKKIVLDENMKVEMFSYLKSQAFELELYKVRKRYIDVFDALNSLQLTLEYDALLFNALSKVDSPQIEKSDFNNLRDLLEGIFKTLHRIDQELLPADLFKQDGRPNLEYCVRYLSGQQINQKENVLFEKQNQPRVPEHIAVTFPFLKSVTSIFSHNYKIGWTRNIYKSTVFAICEVLIWLSKVKESNSV